MSLNFDYLNRIRPIEEEQSTVPQLGRLSNAGNVEDFNDANSALSRNTSNLLDSMRAKREANIKEGQTPLSEKLFRIEMARREARDKAKSYLEAQKIQQADDLIQLKRIELDYNRAKDMADVETERMKNQRAAEKTVFDAEEKYKQGENDYVIKNIQNPEDPEEETFLRSNYAKLNGKSPGNPVQIVQTPQAQTEGLNQEAKKPLTVNQKFLNKKQNDELRKSNIKLQEDTGYVFKPEEEQLSEQEKRNILLKVKGNSGNNGGKEFQYKAGTFAERMADADKVINELSMKGYDRTGASESLKAGITNSIPFGIGEYLKPENLKLQEQAERNFINAILRRESGAAVSQGERDDYGSQYFPRAGDTENVLKLKAENRRRVIDGIAREAGNVLNENSNNNQEQSEPKKSGQKVRPRIISKEAI